VEYSPEPADYESADARSDTQLQPHSVAGFIAHKRLDFKGLMDFGAIGQRGALATWSSNVPRWQTSGNRDSSERLFEINRRHRRPSSRLDFRHTFGSHLAVKGESLFKISELMGNSPEICRKHYAALIPEEMKDTVGFDPRPRTVSFDRAAVSAQVPARPGAPWANPA